MKLLFTLLLAAGLAAALPFPESLPGGLQIVSDFTNGTLQSGTAGYASADEKTIAIINAVSMPASSWAEAAKGLEKDRNFTKGTSGMAEYYYSCGKLDGEAQCHFQVHSGGTYYMVTSSVLGGTESQALQAGKQAAEWLVAEARGDSGQPPSACAPAAGLILVLVIALARKGI